MPSILNPYMRNVNIEHRTLNVQRRSGGRQLRLAFDVERSMLDVSHHDVSGQWPGGMLNPEP